MPQTLVLKVIDRCVRSLHNFSILRLLAKHLFRGVSIRQPFYSGVILLDAVDHSWAWTGKTRYQTHDLELQNKLLSLSFSSHVFIDIGSNIGAMTFSILLRNPQIRAICIDPNARAIQLCQESSRINQLDRRISCLHFAVSDKDGTVPFDDRGSVMGHVGESKKKVHTISFVDLINRYTANQPCLVKIDVEGYETVLLGQLQQFKHRKNCCLVIELHPLGFNKMGNPNKNLVALLSSGASITDLEDKPINKVDEKSITQLIVRWPNAKHNITD